MFYGLSNFFRKILPKQLFYRGLLIVATPIIILQVTISLVFFDSLWIKTNKGMTRALVSEIKTFIEAYDNEDANKIYIINKENATILSELTVLNSLNIDWEDVSIDSNYIYIGDFGNNYGNRDDLVIYKVTIPTSILSNDQLTEVSQISFNYDNQSNLNSAQFNTNFDAEALISYNNKLYIFTKTWVDYETNIYELSKSEGSYSIEQIDNIEIGGLVTAATYDFNNNQILLTGYNQTSSFIIRLSELNGSNFSQSKLDRYVINAPSGYSLQIEGITVDNSDVFLTSEKFLELPAALFKFKLSDITN